MNIKNERKAKWELVGKWFLGVAIYSAVTAFAANTPSKELTLRIRDYLTIPVAPDKRDFKSQNKSLLSRINFIREEPGADRNRLFISDLDGPLYILDKRSKKLTTYLDFNGKGDRKGIFHRLMFEGGFATGFISFQFDPDYRRNGRFYTIHLESPRIPASPLPDNSNFPGFDTKGYEVTPAMRTPGRTMTEAVLVKWTDTNTADTTFEGTARELMRVQLNTLIHPIGDLIFNPIAKPGDNDWRVLYISCGDGGSGEMPNPVVRNNPQRLDTLVGKILRIVPDLNEHQQSSTVSENGRYRVPRDNPFAAKAGARPEIWAYGLRNPHRMSWYVDPNDRKKDYLFANVIGLETWETVVIVHKGANYGYSEREGNQQLSLVTQGTSKVNRVGPLPADDRIPLRIGEEATGEMVVPSYPVLEYGHVPEGGDAISSGLVYQGKIATLRGKYLFGDITTGHIWWADVKEMIAADDGNPNTLAIIHPIHIFWAKPGGQEEEYSSYAPIASATYHARGGEAEYLPGFAKVANGRADIRLILVRTGELFILSKSDGMIREVVGAVEH